MGIRGVEPSSVTMFNSQQVSAYSVVTKLKFMSVLFLCDDDELCLKKHQCWFH